MLRHYAQSALVVVLACAARGAAADVPLGGFIPYLGIGLTDEFETYDTDASATFFIADRSTQWDGTPLGPGASAYFDIALLDTGASAHILTQAAASAAGFSIQAEGFRGTEFQTIFGASGDVDLRINDPLGVYAAGLSNRTADGANLTMNTGVLRGQTSVAILEGDDDWQLPNIIGLPMAAQHALVIRNDQPLIFPLKGRTVRTPNINLVDLGSGKLQAAQLGITRRTDLRIRPSASFLSGPIYLPSTEIGPDLEINFHDNPLSPTVLDSGAMFVEVDMANGTRGFEDKEFLFDTGADLTVISELTAARLGFDVEHDKPDFVLEVEGAGGVSAGVPGFYVDQLNIDCVGGTFTLQNVPVAIRNLPNPNDPANFLSGILGMHVFTGRNLIIDANPAAGQPNSGPTLYVGNTVYETHAWAAATPSAAWASPAAWSASGAPGLMWDAQATNSTGTPKTATVEANSMVYRLTVAGSGAGAMTVRIEDGRTLTTYGEALVKTGGFLRLNRGTLDAQFVNLDGGSLVGTGKVIVGTGPINGAVRNISGRIAPDTLTSPIGEIEIIGDLANLDDGTLAFDIAGINSGQYDVITFDRFAFLGGTLEVKLVDFTPSVGNSFTILTGGDDIFGTFSRLALPLGFTWLVDYQQAQVVLRVTGIGRGPGDFDGNGSVNVADLTHWRAGYGSTYSGQDFLTWQRSLTGGPVTSAVPEPAASALVLAAAVLLASLRPRDARRARRLSPAPARS